MQDSIIEEHEGVSTGQTAEIPKKLHINLPAKIDAELRDLARSVGSSKTDLVMEALGLLKLVYDEGLQGNGFAIISSDGKKILKHLVIARLRR
jgi:hypothetical protein